MLGRSPVQPQAMLVLHAAAEGLVPASSTARRDISEQSAEPYKACIFAKFFLTFRLILV